jgi:hypothetical protein
VRLFYFREAMDHTQQKPPDHDPQYEALRTHFTNAMEAMESRNSAQFASIEIRVEGLENGLSDNTATTKRVEEGMQYVIGLVEAAQKGWQFGSTTAKVIRKIAVWAAPVIVVIGMVWQIAHGRWPSGE